MKLTVYIFVKEFRRKSFELLTDKTDAMELLYVMDQLQNWPIPSSNLFSIKCGKTYLIRIENLSTFQDKHCEAGTNFKDYRAQLTSFMLLLNIFKIWVKYYNEVTLFNRVSDLSNWSGDAFKLIFNSKIHERSLWIEQ